MAGLRLTCAIVSLAAVMAAGSAAHAQQAKPNTITLPDSTFTLRDAFAPDLNQWNTLSGRRSLQWDSKRGRWGLKLDMDQPVGRPLSYTDRDVQAGAYYKITPSFRVGGAVSLGAMSSESNPNTIPADKAPRVRLETAFKF